MHQPLAVRLLCINSSARLRVLRLGQYELSPTVGGSNGWGAQIRSSHLYRSVSTATGALLRPTVGPVLPVQPVGGIISNSFPCYRQGVCPISDVTSSGPPVNCLTISVITDFPSKSRKVKNKFMLNGPYLMLVIFWFVSGFSLKLTEDFAQK